MHLTVIDNDADIAGIRTGQRTLLHTRHNPLEDSRHKAGIDGSTHYAVDEDELTTPLQRNLFGTLDVHLELLVAKLIGVGGRHSLVIGLDDEVYLTKLTGTTRLLLVTVVGTGRLGDGLAVRNTRLLELNHDLLVVLQTPLQRTQVELTLTVDNGLTQLLRLVDHPRGILFAHPVEHRHHLFGLGLVDRLDGTRILGVGVFDKVESAL